MSHVTCTKFCTWAILKWHRKLLLYAANHSSPHCYFPQSQLISRSQFYNLVENSNDAKASLWDHVEERNKWFRHIKEQTRILCGDR